MDKTVTIITPTHWDGKHVPHGTVFRIPEDIDLKTGRRWVQKGIAEIGGEWVPSKTSAPNIPFQELEGELDEEAEERIVELSKRSKEALLEIAAGRLLDVNPKSTKEEIARILVETPES